MDDGREHDIGPPARPSEVERLERKTLPLGEFATAERFATQRWIIVGIVAVVALLAVVQRCGG